MPVPLFIEALEVADRVAGRGDGALSWKIGHFTASRESGPVRAFASRLLGPAVITSMAAGLWGVHYRSAGRAVARAEGPTTMVVSIIDFPTPNPAHCQALGGWMQGALEIGRRTGIRVEERACRCTGAPTCDFRISWTAG